MITEKLFGKDFYEITLQNLKEFFNEEQEESALLEFKEGSTAIEKIYKEVCAFLNTEGGVIIIGTPRETEDKQVNRKFCIGDLVPSRFRSGDWLIQKLAGNISPSPVNIKVREFLTEEGNFFILDIPQSMTPPHQSGDGVYYIRLDKEARPAPHGLVEALFFKRQKPILKVNVSIHKNSKDNSLRTISVSIHNESNFPAEKVSYSVSIQNIKAVIQNGFDLNYGSKNTYTHSETLQQVLWKELKATFNFDFEPFESPFLIVVNAWGRDSEVVKTFGIYDPVNDELIKKKSDFDGNGGLTKAIEEFNEMVRFN